jgi:hypothetical protein
VLSEVWRIYPAKELGTCSTLTYPGWRKLDAKGPTLEVEAFRADGEGFAGLLPLATQKLKQVLPLYASKLTSN